MATAIASNRASSASAGRKAHCPASLPRCSLRGRSGARHAHVAARGSAPPIPFAARRGDRFPGRDGKAGSSIELESCAPAGRPSVMHFYSGPPMHLLSGVDTLPIATRSRPIKHSFDAAAHPASCLWLRMPDRFQRLRDKPNIDSLYRERAEHRINVGRERRWPLRSMLRISPAVAVSFDVAFRAATKGHRASCIKTLVRTLSLPVFDGVDTVESQLALC